MLTEGASDASVACHRQNSQSQRHAVAGWQDKRRRLTSVWSLPPALEMLSVYVELASVSALVTVTVTVVDLPLSGMGGVGIPLATARLFTAMRQLGTAGSAVIATEATRFCSATVYALVLGEKAGCGNKLEFLVWFLAVIFELMQTTGRTVENGYI